MKLLYDHQLSYRLKSRLADLFPNSAHVSDHFLAHAEDTLIWNFARADNYAIVTKDSDFADISQLRGSPPKVVWLRIGNCSVQQIEKLLRDQAQEILDLEADANASILTLK